MIRHLRSLTNRPMLVGTWTDAEWAIRFYEKRGFYPVDTTTKEQLLRRYWGVSDRQIEASTVLVDEVWLNRLETDETTA